MLTHLEMKSTDAAKAHAVCTGNLPWSHRWPSNPGKCSAILRRVASVDPLMMVSWSREFDEVSFEEASSIMNGEEDRLPLLDRKPWSWRVRDDIDSHITSTSLQSLSVLQANSSSSESEWYRYPFSWGTSERCFAFARWLRRRRSMLRKRVAMVKSLEKWEEFAPPSLCRPSKGRTSSEKVSRFTLSCRNDNRYTCQKMSQGKMRPNEKSQSCSKLRWCSGLTVTTNTNNTQ